MRSFCRQHCDVAVYCLAYCFGSGAIGAYAHEAVLIETENCDPFGCTKSTAIDQDATQALRAEEPLGRFVGLEIYFDRGHLAVKEVAETWAKAEGIGSFFANLNNLPFYRSMAFTLTFTFSVTPLMLVFGLMIALGVNALHQRLKGILIFFSLLPMIVSPLIGSLVLFWMMIVGALSALPCSGFLMTRHYRSKPQRV